MPIVLTDHLKIADEIVSARVGDETVILNMKTGLYHGLDVVGTRFFELVELTGDLSEVHRQMLSEFDVPADRLKADLLTLSEEMQAKGILVVSKP